MKRKKAESKPYVDPFLFEVGFFKDMEERQKMIDGVRKINEQFKRSQEKKG